MSIKQELRNKYRRVKNLEIWQSNRIAAFFYPFIKRAVQFLFWALYYSKHVIRKLKHEILKFYARLRRTVTRKGFYLQLARLSVSKGQWAAAKKYYIMVFNSMEREQKLGLDTAPSVWSPILRLKKKLSNGVNKLSFKHNSRKVYRRIKSSDAWHKSRLLAFAYPTAKAFSGVLHLFIHLRRRLRYKTGRFGPVKFTRKFFRRVKLSYRRRKTGLIKFLMPPSLPSIEIRNEARLNISVVNRLMNIGSFRSEIEQYNKQKKQPRKQKIVIYTAISGGYDSLKLPEILNPEFDYVLFTDTPTRGSGVFDIRPLPYFHEDTTRMARFVKTHPHQLLPEYDIAIWIDANIMIMGEISPLIDKFLKSKKPVAAIPHPLRKTITQEAKACIRYGKGDVDQIKEQARHYQDIGYETNKLIESNIMMFNLHDKKIPGFFATWWSEIDKFTRRDQLSLNYAMDTNKIKWHRLMERPDNSRSHPLFTLVPHHVKQTAVLALEKTLNYPKIHPYTGIPFAEVKDKIVAAQQKHKIDIVYCVHNALEDVEACLESVAKHRKSPNVRLIIIDDGSDKPTADFLKKFSAKHKSWVELHRKETASGYTKAANRGLKVSTGDLVILLNSDTIVTDGWTEKMADTVFSTPGVGIVGPLSSAAGQQSIPNNISSANQTAVNLLPTGLTADDMNSYCENWSVAGVIPRVPLVHGFCFGITRETVNKVGYFDEKNFPSGYGEENDYCFRAVDSGIGLVLATNTYIFHAKSKSYKSDRQIELMRQGNEKIRHLHGRERIWRAVMSMQKNPIFEKMRQNAQSLYK
jgi:GT2 family glycosyltransferase